MIISNIFQHQLCTICVTFKYYLRYILYIKNHISNTNYSNYYYNYQLFLTYFNLIFDFNIYLTIYAYLYLNNLYKSKKQKD